MSSKKKTEGARKMGRPPKNGAGAAERVVGLRLAAPDLALLEAIIASEQEKLRASGIMSAVAELLRPADVLRSMIREEAKRRGLFQASVAKVG